MPVMRRYEDVSVLPVAVNIRGYVNGLTSIEYMGFFFFYTFAKIGIASTARTKSLDILVTNRIP